MSPFLNVLSLLTLSVLGPELCGRWLEAGPRSFAACLPSAGPGAVLEHSLPLPQSIPARFSGLKYPTIRKPTSHRKSLGWLWSSPWLSLPGPPWVYTRVVSICLFQLCHRPPHPPAAPPQSLETCSEGGEGPGLGREGSSASGSCCHFGTASCSSTSHRWAPRGDMQGMFNICPIV